MTVERLRVARWDPPQSHPGEHSPQTAFQMSGALFTFQLRV